MVPAGRKCHQLRRPVRLLQETDRSTSALSLPITSTMVGLNKTQRQILIDKVPALANLAAGAMIFGQFLNPRPFSWVVAASGIALWVFLTVCAMAIARREES